MTTAQTPKMGSSENGEMGRHHSNRPPFRSQPSSSMPSTPVQYPRPLGTQSRTPSPTHGLGAHTPRSTYSDAPKFVPAHRAQSVPCRFETIADRPKRRMPYNDQEKEVLERAIETPKEELEPHEDDKLSADMRELYNRLLPSVDSERRRKQLVSKLDAMLRREYAPSDFKVSMFGSSENMLCSSDSDVDICITTSFKKLESMHMLAALLDRHGMQGVSCRASAKVPIVKLWDPELQLACDINVNNPLALENTRMIKTYVQIDSRVRPLAKIVKYWTKRRILNDAAFGSTISSYTWICMIINFLQTRTPPILPTLQGIANQERSIGEDGKASQFADNVESLKTFGAANEESLGQLLFHFFRRYGHEIDYMSSVISVKEGRVLTREEKGWQYNHPTQKEGRVFLCVEEPFNTDRNLGNSADNYSFPGIQKEIRRAFDLIAQSQDLEACCEQYEFPREKKPVFQKPAPKPKPTLTRSASQSGRANAGSVNGRGTPNSSRGARTPSSQRNGGRRASSGALFANGRAPYTQSPPLGSSAAEYISQGSLHDQLYQQYQYLQFRQDQLRTQLAQQAQAQVQVQVQAQVLAQAQAQAQAADSAGSPQAGGLSHDLPSPGMFDSPTMAVLPRSMYHYPNRYPSLSSPMSYSRSRDGSSTNPPSPSTTSAVPAPRRLPHRSPASEGYPSAAVRSQSQPGHTIRHSHVMQGMAHAGYDASAAMGHQYPMLRTQQGLSTHPVHPGLAIYSAGGLPPGTQRGETAIPKEYIGYYVGQSPQLSPRFPAATLAQVPGFHEMPQRRRRITPELAVPSVVNGLRHASRSPSPLGHMRGFSTSVAPPVSAPLPMQPNEQYQQPAPLQPRSVEDGPLIVNGSNTGGTPRTRRSPDLIAQPPPSQISSFQQGPEPFPSLSAQPSNGLGIDSGDYGQSQGQGGEQSQTSTANSIVNGNHYPIGHDPLTNAEPPYLRNGFDGRETPQPSAHPSTSSSPHMSSTTKQRSAVPRLNLSPSAITATQERAQQRAPDQLHESSPGCAPAAAAAAAPLLSPVAELRTPSPSASRGVENRRALPQMNGLVRHADGAEMAKAQTEADVDVQPLPPHLRGRATDLVFQNGIQNGVQNGSPGRTALLLG
ncbi:hypothetical protein LTR28_012800 [Elasticomyces elasticus]|nr:hypothetical protein LTR28_012800 [Elasticomyces elasticus]